MKIFTFKYDKNPSKSALTRLKIASSTSIRSIKNDELVCDSIDTMLKIMSKARFDVFAAIVEYKPSSLYELAALLKKDQANVLKEAKALEALRLITLDQIKEDGREKLKPVAVYDKIVFEFEPKYKKAASDR